MAWVMLRASQCPPDPGIAGDPQTQPFAPLHAQDCVFRAVLSLPVSRKTLILQEYLGLLGDGPEGGATRNDFFAAQLCTTRTFS